MTDKPSINWAFLDAVKFALDMPSILQSLVADGGNVAIGSIKGLASGQVTFERSAELDLQTNDSSSIISQFNDKLKQVGNQASGGKPGSAAARSGLQFLPYITDISNWAKLMTGGSATLFTYEMPYLEFELANFDVLVFEANLAVLSAGIIPIPLVIPVYAFGGVRLYADLSFGYDTYGVQKAFAGGSVLDVLDGFYVNDWSMPAFRNA